MPVRVTLIHSTRQISVAARAFRVYKSIMESIPARSNRIAGHRVVVDEPDAIITIADTAYDVDTIMSDLRIRLTGDASGDISTGTSENAAGNEGSHTPPDCSLKSGVVPGADDLVWQLFQAEAESGENHVADHMRSSVGIVGGLVTRLRRPLHQLARFYANLIARKQRRVNDRLIHVVRMLATQSELDRSTIVLLREEVADLRALVGNARIDDVSAGGGSGDPASPHSFDRP